MTEKGSPDPSDIETDVLVIGGGWAGMAAAVSAAEEGARLVVAEKCSSLGGTTALSIGSITASGTNYQARRGITDSEEDFFEDIAKYNGGLDAYERKDLCRLLVEPFPEISIDQDHSYRRPKRPWIPP